MAGARVLVIAVVVVGSVGQEIPVVRDRAATAIAGRVIAGSTPIDTGRVMLRSPGAEYAATIGPQGEFRLDGISPGWYDAAISSPGWMTHRFKVLAGTTGDLVLPEIRLSPPAYFRIRIISTSGEPIVAPPILVRSYDAAGRPLATFGEPARVTAADPGITSIGPLPRGITWLTIDAEPFARTRLPELRVRENSAAIDGGTVTLEPGSVLEIAVVDANGTPVQGHLVQLDGDDLRAPDVAAARRTDTRGEVVFDRLASGLHRVRIAALKPCSLLTPILERSIEIGPGDRIRRTISIAGVPLGISLSSGGAPLAALEVVLAPLLTSGSSPRWLRRVDRGMPDPRSAPLARGAAPCADFANAAGEVLFPHAPPGPARLGVRLGDSLWTRRVNVPEAGGRLNVSVPAGVLAVHVLSGDTGTPVPGARVIWASGGSEVEAATDGGGHALLQAVNEGSGRVTVRATGYAEAVQENVAAGSSSPVSVRLVREASRLLSCRVLQADSGKPVESALVVLSPADPLEDTHVGQTDASGTIRLADVPDGGLRLAAHAPGYGSRTISIPAESRKPVVLSLERRR